LEVGDLHVEGLGADLDVRGRRRDQVEVPVRVGVGAALGREDQVAVAVGVVGERVEELLAAASALGVEQQDRGVGELAAELAAVGAELLDDLLVPGVELVGFYVFSLGWCSRRRARRFMRPR
jgi:hypothetical protein